LFIDKSYGRGGGLGRDLGVGSSLGAGVGLGVPVGVGVGVGLGAAAQYLPPVFKEPVPPYPPQTII
jgi:hypothetical protein